MNNFLWLDKEFFFVLCHLIVCFFVCVIECWSMYLCKFHYECVRIHTSNCAHIGVLAFIVVTTHFFYSAKY